jgi:CheY-like chemotaxis protein
VSDTGPGIAPDQSARLFTAFEQADASTTRAFGGSGLGLAITRELASSMGGAVGLNSTRGVGSTFWLTVRLAKSSSADAMSQAQAIASAANEHESPEAQLAQAYSGRRVLLVEDDLVNQSILSEMLAATGLLIELANDGEEAVGMARFNRYDAILMDVQMPKLDGLEATRQIRQLPGYARVPIVGVTANAFVEDRQRCAQAGMTDFLTKPVVPAKLHAVLLKWLRQQARLQEREALPASSASAEDALRREYANQRVLIVDDREEHRQLLRDYLVFIWSDMDLAEDGIQAVALAAQKPYDLILMYIQMQPIDGLEATRQIHALPNTSHIPILGLTASTDVADQSHATEAGMNGLLRKVFGPDEPYQTILQALRQNASWRGP